MQVFERKIAQIIDTYQLLPPHGLVLVGLSGGADSVALLRVLLALGYRVEAAHCNFHLRPGECMRDERFVEELCMRLGVRLRKVGFNTKEYAAQHKISLEMAARELRYDFFNQWMSEQDDPAVVAVAHHQNDQAETVLLRLLRGSGVRGLSGMRWRNGSVIRPFLSVDRAQIREYLAALQQDFVEDSSNAVPDVQRNKVRLHVMPRLQEIVPSAVETMARTADHVAEAADYLEYVLRRDAQEVCSRACANIFSISISKLLAHHSPHMLLCHLLQPWGYNDAQVCSILRSVHKVGACFETRQAVLNIDRQCLLLEEKTEHTGRLSYEITPPCQVDADGWQLQCSLLQRSAVDSLVQPADTALLDAGRLNFPLQMRRIRKGDSFQPFGMKGRKLVSDYLTDLKMPRLLRQRQWVVCSGGEIVWLVGLRISGRYAVTAETQKVLLLRWRKQPVSVSAYPATLSVGRVTKE
ncbi:MAG: tRNA lysidine(34) synthetase TilS [Bacteroidaceae bacterium]|nr:tRNA lysidine(34) synthetase TilS [Bacteroidaceae bacterium]